MTSVAVNSPAPSLAPATDHPSLGVVSRSGPCFQIPIPADLASFTLKEVRDLAVAHAERGYLEAVLKRTSGRINLAARNAGIGTRSLYDKMQRYGLRKEDYRG